MPDQARAHARIENHRNALRLFLARIEPLHRALAGALANIDQISHGRLVLGLGVGWKLPAIEREWEACGRVHKKRVKDLEEHVTVWRKLWSGEPVTYQGIDFKLTDQEVKNLGEYLRSGGCIWGDSSLPGQRSRFDIAFRREMLRLMPELNQKWHEIDRSTTLVWSNQCQCF